MARSGQSIENPITGERVVFRKTAAETNGELLQFDLYVKPGGYVTVEHIHARQSERFDILSGTLDYRVGSEPEKQARPGQSFVVPAGAPHVWWNRGSEEMHALIEFRPALEMEIFLEMLFGLARDGKTDAKGNVSFLQIMLFSRRYGLFVPKPPIPLQRVLSTVVAPVALLSGLRAYYPQYGGGGVRA
ncbi:MAG: cupin domain-containing protein [Thermomicrobiales bacterium]